jgi:hypothetical protein
MESPIEDMPLHRIAHPASCNGTPTFGLGRRLLWCLALAIVRVAPIVPMVGCAATSALAQPAAPLGTGAVDAAAVERSIGRGIQYLRGRQLPEGGFPEYAGQSCGLSSLIGLALLSSGVSPEDPAMAKLMAYIRTFEPKQTYAVSLQTMLYCQVGAREDIPRIRTNVQVLEDIQRERGTNGGWTYSLDFIARASDPSNTQFALLALDAAQEAGIPVNPSVWDAASKYWLDTAIRRGSGAWAYARIERPSGSMTCAGIASLVIVRGRQKIGDARVNGESVECCGQPDDAEDDAIIAGLDWLAKNFSVQRNPGADGDNLLYYLYALERVGRLTGLRLIGGHDWYREGCDVLLSMQNPIDGSWKGLGSFEDNPLVSTAFSLLFLSKGKRKVVLARAELADQPRWNQHPEGLRQLTRHIERSWRQDLTWQTITLRGATVADLLQSPVLILSGAEALELQAEEIETLRKYVDGGGFIVLEALAGSGCESPDAFVQSAQQLSQQLVGQPLERLPPDHPVWYAQRPVKIDSLPPDAWLYGAQACCRTPLVLAPFALSCEWQLSDPTGRAPYPAGPAQRIDAVVAIGENLVAYATGRELKDKLDARIVLTPQTDDGPMDRGVLSLPRGLLNAGERDASRALPNMLEAMRQQLPIELSSRAIDVPIESAALQQYPILFLHGRQEFSLDPQQRAALREFVASGGMIMADAICGSDGFATALRRELQTVFTEATWEPLAADHPLLNNQFHGYDIRQVTLRLPANVAGGTAQNRTTHPILEVMRIDERLSVFFSPYDLSCALERQTSLQCPGYSSEDAQRIATNIVLFALQQ